MNLWINTAPGPQEHNWLAGSRPNPQFFPGEWEDADALLQERHQLRDLAHRRLLLIESLEKLLAGWGARPLPIGGMVTVNRDDLLQLLATIGQRKETFRLGPEELEGYHLIHETLREQARRPRADIPEGAGK